MAVPRLIKLPRKYYKTRRIPNAPRVKNFRMQAVLSTDPSEATPMSSVKTEVYHKLSGSLIDGIKAILIDETMKEWRSLKSQGHLEGEVAVVVDGSPTRRIENVSYNGTIQILAPANNELIAEAAQYALNYMITHAQKTAGPNSGAARKGHSMRYAESFVMHMQDGRQISNIGSLAGMDFQNSQYVSIMNTVPYAAYIERYRHPQGTFWLAWKKVRQKYGKQLAIKFTFSDSTTDSIGGNSSVPVALPILLIGQPGAFTSSRAGVRKATNDIRRRQSPANNRRNRDRASARAAKKRNRP